MEISRQRFYVGVDCPRRLLGRPPVNSPRDRHWGPVCFNKRCHALSAHEYQLRDYAAPGLSGEGKAE